jgi:hypothetical protein
MLAGVMKSSFWSVDWLTCCSRRKPGSYEVYELVEANGEAFFEFVQSFVGGISIGGYFVDSFLD